MKASGWRRIDGTPLAFDAISLPWHRRPYGHGGADIPRPAGVRGRRHPDDQIWLLPSPVPPSRHKYSLFYGFRGSRLVGYDNERGKGDHKHLETVEVPYAFVSIERLLNDFRADVERIRGERI
jgi:hypothetical protein